MLALAVYLAILVGLFMAAFLTKRRFGLLGLALAAGSILSSVWGFEAGMVAGVFGLPTNQNTSAFATCVVILIPAIVLMFHGATYKGMLGRVGGSALFAVLAMAFLVYPLSQVLIVGLPNANIFNWFVVNRLTITGLGLIAAIVDVFLTKSSHNKHDKHKH